MDNFIETFPWFKGYDFGRWELQQGVPSNKREDFENVPLEWVSESVKAWEAKNTRYVMIQYSYIVVTDSD